MLRKGRPFQIHEEESYQENLIRAKPRNQRKTFPSMMFLLITFTNNPNRPTSSQVQATGWCKSRSQGRPCGGAGKCPRSVWVARASPFQDRKSTRLNSSHANISYAVFCLKKKNKKHNIMTTIH